MPSDRRLSAEQELSPVFDALAETGDTCRRVRAQADADSARVVEEATEVARQKVARARANVASERAQVAASLRARANVEDAATTATARAQAEDLRQRAAAHLDEQVPIVVARVRQQLAGLAAAMKPPDLP